MARIAFMPKSKPAETADFARALGKTTTKTR
jgi:hypothetical protein